jgi:hypothetical protein
MKWIEEKMKLLGVTSNENYKITAMFDYLAMISVHVILFFVIFLFKNRNNGRNFDVFLY